MDSVFARGDLSKAMPKYQFPDRESFPADVFQVIQDELLLDGNARQNLATFCQTWEEPEIHKIMDLAIDKNMVDKDEYPRTAEIESRCVHMLADLWNSPDSANTLGTSAVGSSEACMLGGMAMKWRWRARMAAQGKPADRPNLVCGPVQICWHKFCRYWDVEMREIPMERERFQMNAEEAIKRVDENTIGVVPTLGVTYDGRYELVEPLAAALDKLQADKGLDVDIHVDGASGAMIAPFLDPELVWDFRQPRVASINTSGHKYGLVYPGVGWALWRDEAALPSELVFNVNYLGGNMPTFALNFSRPGAEVVAQYFTFLRLGMDGFRTVQQASRDVATDLAEEIGGLGPFTLLTHGDELPVFAFTTNHDVTNFDVFDVSRRLRERGWQVPAYTFPANRTDLSALRVVVRNGFTHDLAQLFLDDLGRLLPELGQQTEPLDAPSNASSFRH